VELADPEAAPFESGSTLLTPLSSTDSTAYELSAVHQLTHVAFFSPRPWIYEGLAHFAQALEREQQNGPEAALDFMGRHRTAIADAEKAIAAEHSISTAANESLINTYTEEFYRSKAMYVWWMLRDMIGGAALQKALAAYHSDEDKESSYLQRLIEAQTHRDLEWFFDDWVYRDRGLPDCRVESAYPRATVNGGYLVTVTVENLGDAGAEVPVTLRMQEGAVTKRLEVHAKSKATVRIEAASLPQEVVVNDGSVPESDMSNNVFKVPLPDAAK
jgi:aminopeptidase N